MRLALFRQSLFRNHSQNVAVVTKEVVVIATAVAAGVLEHLVAVVKGEVKEGELEVLSWGGPDGPGTGG